MLLTRPKATREQDRLRKIHRNFYNQLNVLSLIREKFSRLMIVVMVGENFLTARRGNYRIFSHFLFMQSLTCWNKKISGCKTVLCRAFSFEEKIIRKFLSHSRVFILKGKLLIINLR